MPNMTGYWCDLLVVWNLFAMVTSCCIQQGWIQRLRCRKATPEYRTTPCRWSYLLICCSWGSREYTDELVLNIVRRLRHKCQQIVHTNDSTITMDGHRDHACYGLVLGMHTFNIYTPPISYYQSMSAISIDFSQTHMYKCTFVYNVHAQR